MQQQVELGKQKKQQIDTSSEREKTTLLGSLAEQALSIEDPDIRNTFIMGAAQKAGVPLEDASQVDDEQLMQFVAAKQALQPIDKMGEAQKGKTILVEQDGQLGFMTSVFNPGSGQTESSFSPIKGNLVSDLGESREEQMASRVEETRKKGEAAGIGKATAQSIAEKVSSGLMAADSTAILRRTLNLLNEIDTGGFQSVKIKAKQFVGAEGSDEGELTFNLAKNVLQQLKSTFGAAFTAAEGDRLTAIEAGLGRSTEANRRIIKQALALAQRSARRGISAAEKGGESFSFDANEIKKALEFDLNPKPGGLFQPIPGSNQSQSLSIDDLVNKYAN